MEISIANPCDTLECADDSVPSTAVTRSRSISAPSILATAQDIVKLGGPNMVNFALQMLVSTTTFFFVGRLDRVIYLDALSLSTTFINVFGYAFISGFASALDTLVSQSFGNGDFRMCGVYLGRAVLVTSLAMIPTYLLTLAAPLLFGAVGIEPEIVEATSRCCVAQLPVIFVSVFMECFEKFLINQGIVQPQLWIQTGIVLVHPFVCHFYIFTLRLGYIGAAHARTTANSMYAIGMLVYILQAERCRKCVVPPCREMLVGWREYLKVALPATAMIAFEWWTYEILNVLCGRLGRVALCAHAIGMYVTNMVYLVCLGIASGTGALVGNAVGEKDKRRAVQYSAVGTALAIFMVAVFSALILAFREDVIGLFTHEPEVMELTKRVLIMAVTLETIDAGQQTLSRVLICLGKQGTAQWVSVTAFDGVMVPMGYFLTFHAGMGIYGIWTGCLLGASTALVGFVVILTKNGWDEMIVEAHRRMDEEKRMAEGSCGGQPNIV